MSDPLSAAQATVTSLRALFDLSKAAYDINQAVRDNSKALELQKAIQEAREGAMESLEAQSKLLARVREVEAKLKALETWDEEKTHYRMIDVGQLGSVILYELKDEFAFGRPHHLICTKCYGDGRASPIQATTEVRMGRRVRHCPVCKTEYVFSKNPEPSAPTHVAKTNFDVFKV
jgi:hypothetical protein